jgi:hypothetical protein
MHHLLSTHMRNPNKPASEVAAAQCKQLHTSVQPLEVAPQTTLQPPTARNDPFTLRTQARDTCMLNAAAVPAQESTLCPLGPSPPRLAGSCPTTVQGLRWPAAPAATSQEPCNRHPLALPAQRPTSTTTPCLHLSMPWHVTHTQHPTNSSRAAHCTAGPPP